MNFLEERILKDGVVKPGNVLKVESFLNHQMDITLMDQMADEFKRRFSGKPINKVLTIEASGIGIACSVKRIKNTPNVLNSARKRDFSLLVKYFDLRPQSKSLRQHINALTCTFSLLFEHFYSSIIVFRDEIVS